MNESFTCLLEDSKSLSLETTFFLVKLKSLGQFFSFKTNHKKESWMAQKILSLDIQNILYGGVISLKNLRIYL